MLLSQGTYVIMVIKEKKLKKENKILCATILVLSFLQTSQNDNVKSDGAKSYIMCHVVSQNTPLNAKLHCERCSLAQTITKRGNLPFERGNFPLFVFCLWSRCFFLAQDTSHDYGRSNCRQVDDQLISPSRVLSSLIRGPLHHSPYCSRALRRGGCATPPDRLPTPFIRQVPQVRRGPLTLRGFLRAGFAEKIGGFKILCTHLSEIVARTCLNARVFEVNNF